MLIFNFVTAQAQLRCFYCQNCANPFETEDAPSKLCGGPAPTTLPPTGPDAGYPGMEVPHTEETPVKEGVYPEMEVPHSVAPEVVYLQQLRQKRDTAEENTVYNCFTVTEGG